MIRVDFDRRGLRLCIKGHAGAGEPGQDLVCAAGTILMLTLEGALRQLGEREPVSILKKPGEAQLSCCPSPEKLLARREMFSLIFLGYQLLEELYPEHVATRELE